MNEIYLNEEDLDQYLQAHFRFVDISEVDQDMNVMSIVKNGTLEELSFEWDSTNEVEDNSSKLFLELNTRGLYDKNDLQQLIVSGAVRSFYTMPLRNEPATAEVGRIIRRLIKNGCPTNLSELTVILSELEREAVLRSLDTFVVHIEGGIIQNIRGDARANFVILDNDIDGIGLDDEDIHKINDKEYYRYMGMSENDFDADYVESVIGQLKDS